MSWKDDIEKMCQDLDNINKALQVSNAALEYANREAAKILDRMQKKPKLTLVKNEESSLHQDGE